MNRKERRAMKCQQRQSFDREVKAVIEKRIKDAIVEADLIVYINPSFPRFKVHIERSLMEQHGMDFAGALMIQAENNRKEVGERGFNPETFAMIEGRDNQWRGEPVPDLHYLWFKGDTFVTSRELVPYSMT